MWHFLFKKFSFHVRLNLKQIILLKSNLNHTDPIKKKIWFLFNKHTTTQEREGEERRWTHTLACRDTASLCWQKWPFASKPCFLLSHFCIFMLAQPSMPHPHRFSSLHWKPFQVLLFSFFTGVLSCWVGVLCIWVLLFITNFECIFVTKFKRLHLVLQFFLNCACFLEKLWNFCFL